MKIMNYKVFTDILDTLDLSKRQIVNTNLIFIDGNGNITGKEEDTKNINFVDFKKKILRKDIIGTYSSVMVRKKDFLDCGMCNTELPARQDWDLWIRISQLGNAYKLGNIYTKYRIHDNQISSGQDRKINGFSTLLINHKKLFKENKQLVDFYYHLFTIILLKCISKTQSDKFDELISRNFFPATFMKLIVKIIIIIKNIPVIGNFIKNKLSKTYLFKGVKL